MICKLTAIVFNSNFVICTAQSMYEHEHMPSTQSIEQNAERTESIVVQSMKQHLPAVPTPPLTQPPALETAEATAITVATTAGHAMKKRPLHMMPKQPNNQMQRFKCPRCGKDYSQRKNMRRHYRLECGQEPKYPCPVCNLRFKRHNQMSGHMLTRHNMKDANSKVILPDGGAFEI